MEFILPVLSASGEAVIFTLIVIVLFVIGRGRIQPSEKTLVIERPGQYSMVLEPGLNLAQPFIETVAKRLAAVGAPGQENQQLRFEVCDKEVATKQRPVYLLSISWRNGALHFEALSTQEAALHAATAPVGNGWAGNVEEAVHSVAQSWGISLARLGHAQTAVN